MMSIVELVNYLIWTFDWPEVAVFLVCSVKATLFWARTFLSDVLHGAGCSRLLRQHYYVSALDVVSLIRHHVSSKISILTVGGNRNVHTPPSSHFSSWSLHSISVVWTVSAAGLTIAWQHSSRKMVLWRQLRAVSKEKASFKITAAVLGLCRSSLSNGYWFLMFILIYVLVPVCLFQYFICKIRSYCNFAKHTHTHTQ